MKTINGNGNAYKGPITATPTLGGFLLTLLKWMLTKKQPSKHLKEWYVIGLDFNYILA